MPEKLKDARVEGLLVGDHMEWDVEVLQDICNERDCELIKQIPLPQSSKEDAWFWFFDSKGEFTVKSCYRRIRGEAECLNKEFWKKLWGLNLPGKVINMLWRTCQRVLPTALALGKKSVNVSPMCSWCQVHVEDDMHVLFLCSIAKEVWVSMGLAEIVKADSNDDVFTVFKRVFKNCSRDQCGMVGMVCWNLWYRRNNWVWNRVNTSSFAIQSRSYSMLAE